VRRPVEHTVYTVLSVLTVVECGPFVWRRDCSGTTQATNTLTLNDKFEDTPKHQTKGGARRQPTSLPAEHVPSHLCHVVRHVNNHGGSAIEYSAA
jgi:hypothetical protein